MARKNGKTEVEYKLKWTTKKGSLIIEIEKVFPMFRLSIDGLKEGMQKLLGK